MRNRQGRLRDRVAVFACVAIVALIIDQLTKFWASVALADGRTVSVVPHFLSLTLVHNPGASLGFGSGNTWLISLLAIVACIALIVLAVRTTSMRWNALFAFAFAGAAGNLIDRIAYADGFLNGKVVDFLNYGWSVGNVADIFLMVAGIGIVVLIIVDVPFRMHSDDQYGPDDHHDNADHPETMHVSNTGHTAEQAVQAAAEVATVRASESVDAVTPVVARSTVAGNNDSTIESTEVAAQ